MQARFLVGTLFEEEELAKKMNIANTKARDPMGNARWKGAFTGGFEAGYKNTCGSKEGWVPGSFVSSVGNRGERKEQHILDFMDREDLGKEVIGQNISTTLSFSQGQSHPLNISLQESAGEKILAKMKKSEAYLNAPENVEQLQQLLANYEQ
jgi:G patch domain-containing protein 1